MASTPQRLLTACEALHAQNRRLAAARSHVVVFAAGAGASGVAALLGAPGASATLIEARTPYSRAAFDAAAAEAGAVAYLDAAGWTLGGWMLARAAAADLRYAPIAAFYLARLLPRAAARVAEIESPETLLALLPAA